MLTVFFPTEYLPIGPKRLRDKAKEKKNAVLSKSQRAYDMSTWGMWDEYINIEDRKACDMSTWGMWDKYISIEVKGGFQRT